jgi:hypothetical protein
MAGLFGAVAVLPCSDATRSLTVTMWPGLRSHPPEDPPSGGEFAGLFKIRTIAMTCGYYRTSSPVTALPMIMR